jgi:hypothetical protein
VQGSVIHSFSTKNDLDLTNIFSAISLTEKFDENLQKTAGQIDTGVVSSDSDLVVFGSMARYECTVGSDADWTMLVDGQAKTDHPETAHILENLMKKTNLQDPGKSGMFGQITFSHSIIHYVGGQDDTNHNLSRRILLLLESRKVLLSETDSIAGSAHQRVVRGIIEQYIDNDSGFFGTSGKENVPRFLLNDIIRYWRTLCVDFASKQKKQPDANWALRNIKLRMSRKLIFVKGLLMCFKSFRNEEMNQESVKQSIFNDVQKTPLEYILQELGKFETFERDLVELYSAYNEFLGLLNDAAFRDNLKNLSVSGAYGNKQFEHARDISHKFQQALTSIFLIKDSKLRDFTIKYGLF